jgi:rod shape-determining protein MreC
MLLLCALLLSLVFLLPKQSQGLLQGIGQPLAQLVSLPLAAFSALDHSIQDVWHGYLALRHTAEENRRLQREIEALRGRNSELREEATASRRLAAILGLQERSRPQTMAAQIIGRDATNWYRAIMLDKGERDGVKVEMGVIAPDGVVGRVVKTTSFSSMVLLITDSNNAVTGLIQRTRDEGIVEGTAQGRARMKYIPLLSVVQAGDKVITSGLTGGFPKGLPIGTISRIDKAEGDLFQSAELVPEVDLRKLEEVLVIIDPIPSAEPGPRQSGSPTGEPSEAKP